MLARSNGARLGEIESAEQLAHDENIGPKDALGTQRRAAGDGLKGDGGTQIGEAAKGLAQGEQTCFGPPFGGQRIKLRTADRAQQHGAGGKAMLPGLRREGRAEIERGLAADGILFKTEIVAAEVGDRAQDAYGFARDLRPNSIPGKNRYVQFH